MSRLKDYNNFSEEYRLTENLFTDSFDKVLSYFKKKFSSWWIKLLQFLIKNGAYKRNGKDMVKLILPNNKALPAGMI